VEPKSAERVFMYQHRSERYTLVARFDPQLPDGRSPSLEAVSRQRCHSLCALDRGERLPSMSERGDGPRVGIERNVRST